jgi:hypothetical protein
METYIDQDGIERIKTKTIKVNPQDIVITFYDANGVAIAKENNDVPSKYHLWEANIINTNIKPESIVSIKYPELRYDLPTNADYKVTIEYISEFNY